MHLRDCTNAFAGPSERRTTVTEAAAVAAKEVRDTLGLLLAAVHTNTIQHSPVCYARFPCNSDIYAAGDVNTLGTGYVRVTREVRSTLEQACIGVRSDCIRFRNTLARSITTQCAANRYKSSLHLTALEQLLNFHQTGSTLTYLKKDIDLKLTITLPAPSLPQKQLYRLSTRESLLLSAQLGHDSCRPHRHMLGARQTYASK